MAVAIDFPESCTEDDIEDYILDNLVFRTIKRVIDCSSESGKGGTAKEKNVYGIRYVPLSYGLGFVLRRWEVCAEQKVECDAKVVLRNEQGF
jgi:hypothetical protein